ncbi:hypothetical protein FQA39_LY16323 [Lamprigera yunnana]|nr:hypothetical protein FQA39_LY16323 [Lamprigera yunnana]
MENKSEFIPTKSSILHNNSTENFEFVTYSCYKKKDKEKMNLNVKESKNAQSAEFNVKKARHEIFKFGMSGFDDKKKREAKIQLAIKLGAKAPKSKYKNYKLLLDEKKKQKLTYKQNLEFRQMGKNDVGESLSKTKKFSHRRKILKGNLLDAYGTVKVKSKS